MCFAAFFFMEIAIPPAVVRELEAGDWKEAVTVLREIRLGTWLRVESARTAVFAVTPPANLGAGELEVLNLASSSGLTALMDDSDARRFATRMGVAVVGSLGIVARAKSLGLIKSVRPLVEGDAGSRDSFSSGLGLPLFGGAGGIVKRSGNQLSLQTGEPR